MSAQTIAEAFEPAMASYKVAVMEDTWGHLAPIKNKKYRGEVVFALGCFGNDDLNPTVLSWEFGDLESSPWFYEALLDFVGSLGRVAGEVARFDGFFRNYSFEGTVTRLAIYGEQAK